MSQQCGTSEIKIGRGDSIQGGLTDGACKNYATHKDHVVYVYIKISILKKWCEIVQIKFYCVL